MNKYKIEKIESSYEELAGKLEEYSDEFWDIVFMRELNNPVAKNGKIIFKFVLVLKKKVKFIEPTYTIPHNLPKLLNALIAEEIITPMQCKEIDKFIARNQKSRKVLELSNNL